MAIDTSQPLSGKKKRRRPAVKAPPLAPPSPLAGREGRGGITPLDVQRQVGRPGVVVPAGSPPALYPELRLPGPPQAGVQGYRPTPGTVAQLPAGLELQIEKQLRGQMDNTLKNLVFGHQQVFGTLPDFTLSADILASGEIEFATKQDAVRFFKGIKKSFEASGREWELDPSVKTFGAIQQRTAGKRGFTATTDVLDPEMLASFAPKSIEDLLRGPYMKHSVGGEMKLFRDGMLRLDELLIAVPKQWAISQLGTRLQQRQRLWKPDADAVELMQDLNQFLAGRVPKEMRPAPTAVWQPETEQALRFLQMMRASALYLASVKDGRVSTEEGAQAQGFLATQGYSDILRTLDEDIRFKAMPAGITSEQQRGWLDERAAAIEQMWVGSRNPGVSERVALHELGHLNPEALTQQSKQMYGMDHLAGHWGAVKGFLGDAAEVTQIDHLLKSSEFKAAAGWAVPVAQDIATVLSYPLAPGLKIAAGAYEWYDKYADLFLITWHQIDGGSIYRNPASEVGIERRENLWTEYLTAYHQKHGDTGMVGDFIEKWKFYWHNNEAAREAGVRMNYTDELMRDTGMDPTMNVELAFLAEFAWDSLRDWMIFKGASEGAQAVRLTKTGAAVFNASRRMAGSALHIKLAKDVLREQWLKSMVTETRRVSKDAADMDDVLDPVSGRITQAPRAKKKTAVRIVPNYKEFAGKAAGIFGFYHEDVEKLALSLRDNVGKQMRGKDGTFGPRATIDDVIEHELRGFTAEYKQFFDPENWAFWDNLRGKALYDEGSHLYMGRHKFLSNMLEKHYKSRKMAVTDREVPYAARQVGFRIRTAFKSMPESLGHIIDALEQKAISFGEVGELAILKDLRESNDVNRLAAYMQGRYLLAKSSAESMDLTRFTVAKQRALNQLDMPQPGEPETLTVARQKILDQDFIPDADYPDVTRRMLRLEVLDEIDEWLQQNITLHEAPKKFQRSLEKHDPAAAQRWRSYVQVVTNGQSDFIPMAAMYRKWMDPQITPDLRPVKGVVTLTDDTGKTITDEKYVAMQQPAVIDGVLQKPAEEASAAFPVASRAAVDELTQLRIKRYENALHSVGLPTRAEMEAAERQMRIDEMMLKVARAEADKQGGKVTSSLTELQKQAEDIFTAQLARDEAKRASGIILRKQYPRTKEGLKQFEAAKAAAEKQASERIWTRAEQFSASHSGEADVLAALRVASEQAERSYEEVVAAVAATRAEATRVQVQAARAYIHQSWTSQYIDDLIDHTLQLRSAAEGRINSVVANFARIPIRPAERVDELLDKETQDWLFDEVRREAETKAGVNPLETHIDLKRAPKGLTPQQIVNFAYLQDPATVRWYATLLQDSRMGVLAWDAWLEQADNAKRLAQALVDAGATRWKLRDLGIEQVAEISDQDIRDVMQGVERESFERGVTARLAADSVARMVDAGVFGDARGALALARAFATPMAREVFMHYGADMDGYAQMLTALAIRIDDLKRTELALAAAKRAKAATSIWQHQNPHRSALPRIVKQRLAYDAEHPQPGLTEGIGLLDDPRLAIPEFEPKMVRGRMENVPVAGPIREALLAGDDKRFYELLGDFLERKLSFFRKDVEDYGKDALAELEERGFEARQRAMGYQMGKAQVRIRQSQMDMAEGVPVHATGQELKEQGIVTADWLCNGEDFIVNLPDENFYAALFGIMDQIWARHQSGQQSVSLFTRGIRRPQRITDVKTGTVEGKARIPVLNEREFAVTAPENVAHVRLDSLDYSQHQIANPFVIETRTIETPRLPVKHGENRPTGRVPKGIMKTYYVIVDKRSGEVWYAGQQGLEKGRGIGGTRVVEQVHPTPTSVELPAAPLLADAEAEIGRLTKEIRELSASLRATEVRHVETQVKGVPRRSYGRRVTKAARDARLRRINEKKARIRELTSQSRYRQADEALRMPTPTSARYLRYEEAAEAVKRIYGRYLEELPDDVVRDVLSVGMKRGGIYVSGEFASPLRKFLYSVQNDAKRFDKMGLARVFREAEQTTRTEEKLVAAYSDLLADWVIKNIGIRAPITFSDEVVGAGGWIIPATAEAYNAERRIAGVVSPQRRLVNGEWVGPLVERGTAAPDVTPEVPKFPVVPWETKQYMHADLERLQQDLDYLAGRAQLGSRIPETQQGTDGIQMTPRMINGKLVPTAQPAWRVRDADEYKVVTQAEMVKNLIAFKGLLEKYGPRLLDAFDDATRAEYREAFDKLKMLSDERFGGWVPDTIPVGPRLTFPVNTATGARQMTFEIVKQPFGKHIEGVIDGHRSRSGMSVINAPPGKPGALGNPVRANDVRGGKVSRAEAVAEFERAFLHRVETDPEYRAWVLTLRGKKVGYYKPDEEFIHLKVVQEWLRKQPVAGAEGVQMRTFKDVAEAEQFLRDHWVRMRMDEDLEHLRLAHRSNEFVAKDARDYWLAEWERTEVAKVRAYLNREDWGPVNARPNRMLPPALPGEAAVPGLHTLPEVPGPRVYDPAVLGMRGAELPAGRAPAGLLPAAVANRGLALGAATEPLALPVGRATGRTIRESWEAGEISADDIYRLTATPFDPKVAAAQLRLKELRAAERALKAETVRRFAVHVEKQIDADEAMFRLKQTEAVKNGGVARDDLDQDTKDRFRRVAASMGGSLEDSGKSIRLQIEQLEENMQLLWHDPERALGLVSQPAMEWQLRTWHTSRYNYSKMAKFQAGPVSRAIETAWASKWIGKRWSIDDATTLYKTVVMFKLSTMLRIVLADEFVRMIVEDKINPLTAWKGSKLLRAHDKMPDDQKFKVSELIRQSIEHPYQWIDPDYKGAWTVYEHLAAQSRRDPTFGRFLAGRILWEREGIERLGLDVDKFLDAMFEREFYQGDQHLVELIKNYRKNAAVFTAEGSTELANEELFKAWYALGYLKGGPLRKIGLNTHRFVTWGDKDELFLQGLKRNEKTGELVDTQNRKYKMGGEDYVSRQRGELPGAIPDAQGGIRGDAGGLLDALYQQFDYFYNHSTLGVHWRPQRPVTPEQLKQLSDGKVPRGMEFGKLDKGDWKALCRLQRMDIGETFLDGFGRTQTMTAELKMAIAPRLWGRSEGMTTGGIPAITGARDLVYSVLDYVSSKMNEWVYANAFMDNVNTMRAAFPERSWEEIEERAHFAAREHMERVQYTNMSYGAEEYLRNIFMFLPAYRQFYEFWIPYLATHPYLATVAYRMNRDKKEFQEFQVGPLQLDLTRMSFLFNQSDNMVTGWLPGGAPLITFPVSAMATKNRDEKDNFWGNLAGNWPFDFSGEYTALNSPLDKMFYGVTGETLPWPLGTDPAKNEWRALQDMREKLISEDKLSDAGDAMWHNRLTRLFEGGWNFLVPVGMRVNDEGVTQMVQAKIAYNEAQTPEQLMAVLAQPGNEVFATFIEWQNLASWHQMKFLKEHPEIVPYTVSGFTARSDEPSAVGFLWNKMRNEGVPDPAIFADRIDDKYMALNKVIEALDARKVKEREEKWWKRYKVLHEGDHNLFRLENEWQHSEGAFAPGGRFYAQGKIGYAELTRDINLKFIGIEDPFTGISNTTGDAYRYAKFMDQMGGATKKLLQLSPNYEMYEQQKLIEHTQLVTDILKGYAETRMATRLRPSQIMAAGYTEQEAAAIHEAVARIDRIWDGANKQVKQYGKGGYTTSEGRKLRKAAIEEQNRIIHSSPLMEKFLGNNIGAMYGSTYLAKPVWERQDFVRLDDMDPLEREMFYHLTSEIDPETKQPRWSGVFLPEKERRDISAGTVLGYVPKKEGGTTVWYTKLNVNGVIGLVKGRRPKGAAEVELTWKQAYEIFDHAFGDKVPTPAQIKQWRRSMDALPQWSQDLIEEGLRAQAWQAWLKWASYARRELRDTTNEYYGDAPGFSLLSKFGTKWKKEMLRYGTLLGRYSPTFKREYDEYNGNNEMVNSLLGWYL